MTDHTYYMSALNQNIGYNQPNNLGYYLGTDMDKSQVPLPTSIHSVATPHANSSDAHFYDLSGRLVSHPMKGLYIRNGKKIVIR